MQLRGSDRVAILIDGKQSSLTGFGNQTGLDSIPAGSIASIEIINNPSAAYDAAGMAGVINIVYRKDQTEGLQIDVGLHSSVGAARRNARPICRQSSAASRRTRRSIRASTS